MISLDKAIQLILNDSTSLELDEISVRNAYGRVLGKDIVAESDIPKFNISAIDGYAIASSDTENTVLNKPSNFLVRGESQPGKLFEGAIRKGDAIKVHSGVRLPNRFDAVVKFEDAARTEAQKLNVYVKARPWQNVIRAGREISAGEDLMPAGRVLNAADMARLIEVGLEEIEVYKRQIVGLISVGHELLTSEEDDRNPGFSRIQYIRSLITENGAEFIDLGVCSDSIEDLEGKLSQNDDWNDLIIMANQSIDHYNFLKNAFREIKIDLKFWRVALKPGKSVLYGTLNKKQIFGISGNLWAVTVVFNQLIKPMLMQQSGLKDTKKLEVYARLTKELHINPTLTQVFKAIVRIESNGFTATPLIDPYFGELTALSMSNGFIIISPNATAIRAGDKVRVEVFGSLAASKSEKRDNDE